MNMLSVFRPARFHKLLTSDANNVSRDPSLVSAIFLSLLPAIALAFWGSGLDQIMFSKFEVRDFTRSILGLAICLPAFLIGWVTGFLFLEDRDDGVLLAVDITPIGKRGLFAYRVAITAVITMFVTLFSLRLLLPDLGWGITSFVSFLVPIEAVCAALILPAIARNKVEGLAVTKVTNIAAIIPLLVMVPSPLRYIGAVIPTYWIGELLQSPSMDYLSMPAIIGFALLAHIGAAFALYSFAIRRLG